MKNNESPGSGGFSFFFKFFFVYIGHFLVRSINGGFVNEKKNRLRSAKVLLHVFLRKKTKAIFDDLASYFSCEPSYKIASAACIANRLKFMLPTIIH